MERYDCLRCERTYGNDLRRRRRSSTRPVRRPRHGTSTDVQRNLHVWRVPVEMDGRVVLLRTLRGNRQRVLWRKRRTTRARKLTRCENEVKATNATLNEVPSALSHVCSFICACLASVAQFLHLIFYFFRLFFVPLLMFPRLLIRWPRSSPVALHAPARAFRATSLALAPSAATVLKPRLAPATFVHEPPVDQSTNRAHFSSTKFADAPISNSSKMAIPHEYASLHPSLFGP